MSDRLCNRCEYLRLEQAATDSGRIVTIRPRPVPGFPDGVDVYVHPPDYVPPLERTEEAVLRGWWAVWFANLPEQCSCSK
jgi:hypothetical protein